MVHRIKFNDVIGHMIRQPYCLQKIPFKNLLFWSGWTNRGETLHVWPPVHEEQKVHTYDIIGHIVWQPYWIYPQTYKKKIHHSKEVLVRVCNLWLLFSCCFRYLFLVGKSIFLFCLLIIINYMEPLSLSNLLIWTNIW